MCKFLYKQAGLALPQAETSHMYDHSFISPILFVTCRCYSNAHVGEPTESDRGGFVTQVNVCVYKCLFPWAIPVGKTKIIFIFTLLVFGVLIVCAFYQTPLCILAFLVNVQVLNCTCQHVSYAACWNMYVIYVAMKPRSARWCKAPRATQPHHSTSCWLTERKL
jgi:hypothetical protein